MLLAQQHLRYCMWTHWRETPQGKRSVSDGDYCGQGSYFLISCHKHFWKQVLLLLLSHFSHVQPLATPWTAAYQAPPSMGFSRQEYWSGLPFPSLKAGKRESKRKRAYYQNREQLYSIRVCSFWKRCGKKTSKLLQAWKQMQRLCFLNIRPMDLSHLSLKVKRTTGIPRHSRDNLIYWFIKCSQFLGLQIISQWLLGKNLCNKEHILILHLLYISFSFHRQGKKNYSQWQSKILHWAFSLS